MGFDGDRRIGATRMAGAEMESAECEALVAEEADIVAWEESRWWGRHPLVEKGCGREGERELVL